MSSLLRIGYVVEGKTDYLVLDAVVERLLGNSDYISTQIQPPNSAFTNDQGTLGGGWKGVLKWCESFSLSALQLADSTLLANNDFLIIHVDADIAQENDLINFNLQRPCPPAKDACDRIRAHLISLLGGNVPHNVIICVPSQCTEAWLFAILHPDEIPRYQPIECRMKVADLLISRNEGLVRIKSGATRKLPEKYRLIVKRITDQWPRATAACPEALRFEEDFQAAISL